MPACAAPNDAASKPNSENSTRHIAAGPASTLAVSSAISGSLRYFCTAGKWPPSTMVSGLSTFARIETPIPSQCACSASAASTRRRRPPPASSAAPSWRPGRCVSSCTGSSRSAAWASSAASPTPVSQQPRRPQPQSRSVGPTVMCPTSPAKPVCAPDDPAVDDHAGADPDRTGDEQQVLSCRRRPTGVVRDGAHVGVVVDPDPGVVSTAAGPSGCARCRRPASAGWARRTACRRRHRPVREPQRAGSAPGRPGCRLAPPAPGPRRQPRRAPGPVPSSAIDLGTRRRASTRPLRSSTMPAM